MFVYCDAGRRHPLPWEMQVQEPWLHAELCCGPLPAPLPPLSLQRGAPSLPLGISPPSPQDQRETRPPGPCPRAPMQEAGSDGPETPLVRRPAPRSPRHRPWSQGLPLREVRGRGQEDLLPAPRASEDRPEEARTPGGPADQDQTQRTRAETREAEQAEGEAEEEGEDEGEGEEGGGGEGDG